MSELPFDALKIDQSFVRSMNDNESAMMMVKTILQLARNLGLGLIAEGIETEEQLAALVSLGCERGQGFHLGLPQPSSARTGEEEKSSAGIWKPRRGRTGRGPARYRAALSGRDTRRSASSPDAADA